MKVCRKCILPENFKDIKINDDGICSYCSTNTTVAKEVNITDEYREEKIKEIDKLIENNRGKDLYDCVVGFSGGKDSTYLLWYLKNKYNLNILAVVIDHGFFPDITTENVNLVQKKLGIDVIKYSINSGFMERFFKYKFENYKTKAIFDDVCADCSNILEGNVMKIAASLGISLVFIGLSPEQVNRYFYEIPRKHLLEEWCMDAVKQNENFSQLDYKYSWNADNCSDSLKVILPFHVWEYSEDNIVNILKEKDILPLKNSNPLMTRCKILDTMCYLDKNRIGYDGFIAPFSDLIRLGKAPREKYYEMFYGDGYEINMDHVNEVIERLNLDIEKLINKPIGV